MTKRHLSGPKALSEASDMTAVLAYIKIKTAAGLTAVCDVATHLWLWRPRVHLELPKHKSVQLFWLHKTFISKHSQRDCAEVPSSLGILSQIVIYL